MSILVIGSTGTIGSLVVQGLADQGASVTALVRQVGKASLPAGVNGVVGDLTNVQSLRTATGALLEAQVLPQVDRGEQSEAQLQWGPRLLSALRRLD